jgi:hypothetical protein
MIQRETSSGTSRGSSVWFFCLRDQSADQGSAPFPCSGSRFESRQPLGSMVGERGPGRARPETPGRGAGHRRRGGRGARGEGRGARGEGGPVPLLGNPRGRFTTSALDSHFCVWNCAGRSRSACNPSFSQRLRSGSQVTTRRRFVCWRVTPAPTTVSRPRRWRDELESAGPDDQWDGADAVARR